MDNVNSSPDFNLLPSSLLRSLSKRQKIHRSRSSTFSVSEVREEEEISGNRELTNFLLRLKDTIEEKDIELQSLKNEKEESLKLTFELENKIENLEKLSGKDQNLESRKLSILETQLNSEVRILKDKIELASQSEDELYSKIKKLNFEANKKSKKISELAEINSSLNQELKENEGEFKSWKRGYLSENKSLRENNNSLEKSVKHLTEELEELKNRIIVCNDNNRRISDQKLTLDGKLTESHNLNIELLSERDENRKKTKVLEKKTNSLEFSLDKLREKNQVLTRKIFLLESKLVESRKNFESEEKRSQSYFERVELKDRDSVKLPDNKVNLFWALWLLSFFYLVFCVVPSSSKNKKKSDC